MNINKRSEEFYQRCCSDNNLSNREKGYHSFTRAQVVEALDDFSKKKGWKWGNHGKKKTSALMIFYPRDQSIVLVEP